MINKIKQKIISIYLPRRKFFNALGISLVFLLILILILTKNKKGPTKSTPEPQSQKTSFSQSNTEIPYTYNEREEYYINQIVTNLIPVTGYSWNGDKLIYSTDNGIYEAGTNTPVVNLGIESIKWSDSFNALIKSNGKWSRLIYSENRNEDINLPLNNPILSPDGNKILDFKNNQVFLYDIKNNINHNIKFDEPVENIFFVNNSKDIIVSTVFGESTYVHKLDSSLINMVTLNFDKEYRLSSISPTGNNFILVHQNQLIIASFEGTVYKDLFLNKSELVTLFRNNQDFVVVEKYRDNLGRVLDNIYLSDILNKRIKISDSKPITNRINYNIPLMKNGSGVIISFAENKGKIWIVSLKPNLYPTYSTSGELVFSNLKPKGI